MKTAPIELKAIISAKAQAKLEANNPALATRGKGYTLAGLSKRQVAEALKSATLTLRRAYEQNSRAAQLDLGADLVSAAFYKIYDNPELWDSEISALHTFIVNIAKKELKKNMGRYIKREGTSYSQGAEVDGETQEFNVGNGEISALEQMELDELSAKYTAGMTIRERIYVKLAMGAVSVAERNELKENGLFDASYYTDGEIGELMGMTATAYRKWKFDFQARNAKRHNK